MNKYARFNIAVCIDMTVVAAACNASADILSVVLEIHDENLFRTCRTAYLADAPDHIFALFDRRNKAYICTGAHRHIIEIPAVAAAVLYEQVKEFVRCDRLAVSACVAD